MVDWAQLPYDLLTLIGTRLETEMDTIRFRSVCTSWRKSLPSTQYPVLSILPNASLSNSSWGFSFSKRTLFLLSNSLHPFSFSNSVLTNSNISNSVITDSNSVITNSDSAITDSNSVITNSVITNSDSNSVITNSDSNSVITDSNSVIKNSDSVITDSDSVITNSDSNSVITDSNSVIKNSNSVITDSNSVIKNSNSVIKNSNSVITDSNSVIKNSNSVITDSNSVIKNSNSVITDSNSVIKNSNSVITDSNSVIKNSNSVITDSDSVIKNSDSVITDSDSVITNSVIKKSILNSNAVNTNSVSSSISNLDLNENSSWIVKIEQNNDRNITHLLNPLGKTVYDVKFMGFNRGLDLMNIRVFEVGSEYILRYINYRPFANSISDAANLYMEKVACRYDSIIGYVLLTIHVTGKLAMFKVGDKKWTIVEDFASLYDDVALFEGKFYAVDNMGRTVVVGLDPLSYSPVVELVANPTFGGDKKTLVASDGELLLVDTYLSVGPEDDSGFEEEVEFYEEFDCYMSERTVRFKVFKLDWEEKKWNEVKDLGDRMLFLGDYSTFSAHASDFNGCKGNCIIFADHNFYSGREEEGVEKGCEVGVFDLESGSIGSLVNHPQYLKMFWPPPSWVSAATLEDGLNRLGIRDEQ